MGFGASRYSGYRHTGFNTRDRCLNRPLKNTYIFDHYTVCLHGVVSAMSNISVTWRKCGNDSHWCDFFRLDLSNDLDGDAGVYIIFYLTSNQGNGRVVRVGQGNVAERLASHRQDTRIIQYKPKGLLVT